MVHLKKSPSVSILNSVLVQIWTTFVPYLGRILIDFCCSGPVLAQSCCRSVLPIRTISFGTFGQYPVPIYLYFLSGEGQLLSLISPHLGNFHDFGKNDLYQTCVKVFRGVEVDWVFWLRLFHEKQLAVLKEATHRKTESRPPVEDRRWYTLFTRL